MLKTCLCVAVALLAGCAFQNDAAYKIAEKQISVDGDAADWKGIKGNTVNSASHLWVGQGMELENWKGKEDLSFSWKAAWQNNKLYFLVIVNDENVQQCTREYSWLNDCVEIYLDPEGRGGQRIQGVEAATPIEERIGKKIHGYEMHYLPCSPPRVYLDDTISTYKTENPQNEMFFRDWKGEIAVSHISTGYVLEIGLTVPNKELKEGMVMGVDVGVCDDDGSGREGLLLWNSGQTEFWITMDYFGKVILTK